MIVILGDNFYIFVWLPGKTDNSALVCCASLCKRNDLIHEGDARSSTYESGQMSRRLGISATRARSSWTVHGQSQWYRIHPTAQDYEASLPHSLHLGPASAAGNTFQSGFLEEWSYCICHAVWSSHLLRLSFCVWTVSARDLFKGSSHKCSESRIIGHLQEYPTNFPMPQLLKNFMLEGLSACVTISHLYTCGAFGRVQHVSESRASGNSHILVAHSTSVMTKPNVQSLALLYTCTQDVFPVRSDFRNSPYNSSSF